MTTDKDPGLHQPLEVPAFEALSPEQQQAIMDGPGWVKTPVALDQFEDLDHFMRGSNNFFSYFSSSELAQYAYKSQPFYKRFEIVFPELTEELNNLVDTAQKENRVPVYDKDTAQKLFQAYELMSQLVDRDDPYALESDNQVNVRLLYR